MLEIKHVSVGVAHHNGLRASQEDRYFIAVDFAPDGGMHDASQSRRSVISVFDGHGRSAKAAEYCAERVPQLLSQCPALFAQSDSAQQTDANVAKALRETFKKVDDELLFNAEVNSGDRSGTTAVVAVTFDKLLYTAHVGDSRAILVRDGEAARLTEDHKPSLPEEYERIKKAGGQVIPESNRVMGRSPSERMHMLAMSRAIGDPDFKPEGKMIVSSTPDVRVVELDPSDTAVVVASDGLWDVMQDQEAAHIVSQFVTGATGPDLAKQAAKALVHEALQRETGDNVTVAVLCYHWA